VLPDRQEADEIAAVSSLPRRMTYQTWHKPGQA